MYFRQDRVPALIPLPTESRPCLRAVRSRPCRGPGPCPRPWPGTPGRGGAAVQTMPWSRPRLVRLAAAFRGRAMSSQSGAAATRQGGAGGGAGRVHGADGATGVPLSLTGGGGGQVVVHGALQAELEIPLASKAGGLRNALRVPRVSIRVSAAIQRSESVLRVSTPSQRCESALRVSTPSQRCESAVSSTAAAPPPLHCRSRVEGGARAG